MVEGERIVVFGGNSYVGNYLAQYAAARGRDVVTVTSGDCDLLDPAAAARFFASLGGGPFSVVFLAVINKQAENGYRSFTLNNAMAKNFLDGLRPARVGSVIWFSSVDVYGAGPRHPITEETPVAPDTWYGLAKYNGEWMARSSGDGVCPVTILRIPGVYGNAKNDRSVIGKMVRSVRETGRVFINGSGKTLRDFVFIEDLVRLVLEILPRRHHGVVNVATGSSLSVLEVVMRLKEALGRDFEVEHRDSDAAREFDLCFDNHLLTTLVPGFQFTEVTAGMRGYRWI